MVEKIIEEMNKKYYLDIYFTKKFSRVFNIYFIIEGKELTFIYMYDNLLTYESNKKEFEKRLNNEIINFYIRKEK